MVNISYDSSGTHSLQSLLELINLRDEENIIINSIIPNCLEMCFVNFNNSRIIMPLM